MNFWRESVCRLCCASRIRQVEEDDFHIGLLFHPAHHPTIRSQVVSRQPICLIVPVGHPLSVQNTPVTLPQLLDFPLALTEKHFGVRQLLAMAEFEQKIRFQPQMTTNSIAVLKHFVRSGMGLTLLPTFVVASEIADGQLVAIEIDDAILRSGETHIITRLGRSLLQGAHKLLQHLTQWMKAFQSQ